MPTLTSGSNVTLTVAAGQILTVQSDGATFDFENPVGTRVGEYASDTVFGPFSAAGSVKVTSVQGAVFYELGTGQTASTPYIPSNVTITGGTIGGASVVGLPKSVNLAISPWMGKPVANESCWTDGQWTTVYGTNTRKRYITNRATSFVRLVYSHVGTATDTNPTAPLTVRASVEATNGATRRRVTFGGKIDGEIAPGCILVSDPVQCIVAAGAQFWVWTYASSPNLFFMNVNDRTVVAWGEGCDASFNTAASDKTLSGTIGTNAVSHYSPMVVIGDTSPSLPFVGHFGDSIGSGLGDVATPDVGRGFLRRAMNNTIPFVNLCVSGDVYGNNHVSRYALMQGCTDVIDQMGINDVQAGASLATVQASMVSAWQILGASGARVWRTTLTPASTSTDTWATLANQTPSTRDNVRVPLNDWIRDGAPLASAANLTAVATGTTGALRAGSTGHPLTGYFETADTVESSRNSGKWIVGSVYTTDGTGLHPNSTGAAAMAAAINTARFTA